jgi:hypothetical protein
MEIFTAEESLTTETLLRSSTAEISLLGFHMYVLFSALLEDRSRNLHIIMHIISHSNLPRSSSLCYFSKVSVISLKLGAR